MWMKYLAIAILFIILAVLLKRYMVKLAYRKKLHLIESKIEFLEQEKSYHSMQIGALTMAGENMEGEYMQMLQCEDEIEILKKKLVDEKLIWESKNK